MNQPGWLKAPLLEWIFYGNYFYGLCAAALSAEASLQQQIPLSSWIYYSLIFLATVLYYNYPYARRLNKSGNNPRTAWFIHHYQFMWWNQVIISVILLIAGILLLIHFYPLIQTISLRQWLLLLVFPIIAGLYYGLNMLSTKYNLRSIGWLKPFIIGFTWAGLVTVYPVLWYHIYHGQEYYFSLTGTLLFIKNGMFIAMLCIMFDIKDYATDYSSNLKTFVVRMGLRKTIFYILLPLPVLGLFTFITYALTHQFSAMKILLNMIPFLLLLLAAGALRKRRSMMYYLVVIDGLMLVKAACGIIAMLLF